MKIVFLFLFLSIGFFPFAFAEQGINYDKEIIETLPDGRQVIKHTVLNYDRILDDGTYKDYIFSDVGNALEIKTAINTIHLDKVTCGFSFYNKNNVLLFQDSIIAFNSIVDQYTWNAVTQVNNAICEAYYDLGENALVAKRYASGVGYMEYKYIFNNGNWKTQLEATNLTTLTNRVFAFDQTIDINRDVIKFGEVNRNLDNFNGQTFDRTFLENNKANVLELLNGFNFDFDIGFDYLDSITVTDTGLNKSKLTFHYMRNNEILMPNETLIIDPTFTDTTGSNGRITSTTVSGTSCSATANARDGNFQWGKQASSLNDICTTGWVEFDISGADPTWTVDSVTLEYDITTAIVPGDCTWRESTVQPSTGSIQTVYDNGRSGTALGASESACTTVANGKIFTFNAAGIANVQSKIDASQAWYGMTVFNTNQTRGASSTLQVARSNDAILSITYHIIPPPDSITDLTADSVGTTTASLSFTPPNLNGETLINYMLNVTTPQQDTPPSTFWMNGSASPFSVIGLTEGTDYSASASAYTAGGGNWTLANVLNFTTNELPAGTFSIDNGNVGDTLRMNGTVTLSASIPLPANATALKLYKDNILVKTDTILDSIPSLGSGIALDSLWYQITDDSSHQYALVVTVNNDAGSVDIMGSPNATLAREYNPDYFPAVDNPATQGSVNATLERYDDQDGLLLKVNRIGVSTGDTWQIECIAQTNTEASQTKNQSATWAGDWQNATNTGYFNTTYTGYTNSHAYITCFNEDELFSLTSFTNSSLALLGIELFDQSYGSMLGVPVGVFFLVMTAGMANKRTAPTFIIVITGIAGTMATIGFFSFDPLVWGLALVTAMLGIFVNQKIF